MYFPAERCSNLLLSGQFTIRECRIMLNGYLRSPMYSKDYYAILELTPAASLAEIKKAYRKQALQLHPDKTGQDPYAAARFAEIKEAYEILSDPAKKEYYLQGRWYAQSIGRKKTQPLITPENMLIQAIELERYVSRLDPFRLDREGLLQYMLELFNADTILQLQAFDASDTIRSIIRIMLKAMRLLNASQANELGSRLMPLAGNDPLMLAELKEALNEGYKQEKAARWWYLVPVLLTVLICLLMYLAGR